MKDIFILLVIFQIKHFICDYPLQGKYMLGKFKPGWSWVLPMLAHVCVTAGGTLAICLWYKPDLWWLAFVDFGMHFTMDRIKAGPKYLGRFKDMAHKYFWWALGLDQGFHHCTHYLIIYMLLKY